jgi:hypothetical protein
MVIAEAWVKFIHQLSITAFGQTPALVRVSGSCLRATSLPNVLAGGAVFLAGADGGWSRFTPSFPFDR